MAVASNAEELFALHLRAHRIPYEREVRFAKPRRFRADFLVQPDILVEIEGVTHYGRNKDGSMRLGRHQTAKGYASDCTKYNLAALKGYRVLRFTPAMVKSCEAIETVRRAIGATA